jgi:hypothetical protein
MSLFLRNGCRFYWEKFGEFLIGFVKAKANVIFLNTREFTDIQKIVQKTPPVSTIFG